MKIPTSSRGIYIQMKMEDSSYLYARVHTDFADFENLESICMYLAQSATVFEEGNARLDY